MVDKELDLIIMDMNMPGISGEELFNQIRSIRNDIGILIASGDTTDPKVIKLLELENCSVIQKPFKTDILGRLIIDRFKVV
jgi:DNA-binding response OmpR family regulator